MQHPVGPRPWLDSPGSLLISNWPYFLSRAIAWGCSSTPCCRSTLQGSGPYLTRPASKLLLDPRCRHNSSPQTTCENGKAQCDLRSAHPTEQALYSWIYFIASLELQAKLVRSASCYWRGYPVQGALGVSDWYFPIAKLNWTWMQCATSWSWPCPSGSTPHWWRSPILAKFCDFSSVSMSVLLIQQNHW